MLPEGWSLWLDGGHNPGAGVVLAEHLRSWSDQPAHLVVGMRGHSAVCAVGLGVPCVAVSTHAKVEGFMGKCGLGDWVAHPGRDMEERLRELCRRALEDPGAYRRIRDAGTAGFADRFRGFMRRCLDLVG